jgi:hypothetical protein
MYKCNTALFFATLTHNCDPAFHGLLDFKVVTAEYHILELTDGTFARFNQHIIYTEW